jgi:small GTP-binding protein
MSCFEWKTTKKQYRTAVYMSIFGDVSVGKTSLLQCFVNHEFPDTTEPTFFDYFSCTLTHGDREYEVMLFDTAGKMDETKTVMPQMLRRSEGVLVVYDESRLPTLQNLVLHWLPWIFSMASELKSILLIGNKTDLLQERSKEDQAVYDLLIEMAQRACGKRRMQLARISARVDSYETLEALFTSFAQRVVSLSTAKPSLLIKS